MSNETQKVEVMDLTKIASTFPQLRTPNIRRDNMIETLAEMLKADTEVVIVEGPDGIGKTTLLAQFACTYPHNTFALFVRSSSRWAYDSGMLRRDLCDQIGWSLKKQRVPAEKGIEPSQLLAARLYELQRQANSESATYYFVVDGLNEIPEEDIQEREMILKLLPFGIPHFRFVLSGPLECLRNRSQKISGISPFRLAGFTFEETREFFSALIEDRGALETIHKVSKMVPGNLASVRRLLQAGATVEQLLEELMDHPPEWFELEWRVVENTDTLLCNALAILAFDRRRHSISSLSHLCKTEPATLDEKLASCNFVERKNNGKEVEFVCDVFGRFAAKRLHGLRRNVLDTVIADLLIAPENDDALTHLPGFLHQAGRYEELLNYLSPEHIGRLIDCSDSWVPLHQKADLGVDTAMHLNRDGDLLRFGLQRAMITSMECSEPWRSEIEAYVGLNDFSAAYALVQRMVTREDRLHLLAVIARAKKTKFIPVEVELNDQIQQLYRLLDRSSLGERGVEIASDLLYTHPELAVGLVQECTGKGGDENSLDLALAELSFKAMMEREDGIDGMESTQRTLRAMVKDPTVQRFMDTTAVFFGGYSADAVIAEVNKWDNGTDRIFALRSWAVTNAKQKDAAVVIEYTMSTILKTTSYTANAKVYADCALPLVHIPDIEQAKTIISRLDGLKGPIESAGPTVEYVELQATLAKAEARYAMPASFNRLQDIYVYVETLPEPATRLVSFAVLAGTLKEVDRDRDFDKEGPIHDLVLQGLQSAIDEILTRTADHFKAVRPAIGALARSDTKIALEVISKLNTNPRREAALVEFIRALAGEVPSDANFVAITDAYRLIKSISMQAKATLVLLRKLVGRSKDLAPFVAKVITLHDWVKNIPDSEQKCQALCILLEILFEHRSAVSSSLTDSLAEELGKVWDTIDSGWSKVDAGFRIVSMMAKCFPEISRGFLAKTEKARSEIILDCHDTAMSYISCVRLTLRCFGGLLTRALYTQNDFDVLQELINRIPAVGMRMIIWSDLALKFALLRDVDHCRAIVSERIRPILETDTIGDTETRWQVIALTAPALHCAHDASARQLIDQLPQPYRDHAYSEICSFLITGHLPTESYDHSDKSKKTVTYEDFLDVCDAMQRLEADDTVYWHLEALVDAIHKRFNKEFNRAQIADMLQKLQILTNTKFPNPDYIKHEGYKILAEAHIGRLDRNTFASDNLSKRARAIPNVADSAFVLIGIAAVMPPKDHAKATVLLQEAQSLIPGISLFEDRVGRYEHLAKVSANIDKRLSKECLRQAWHETMPLDSEELSRARRRIVDFAHRLDPDFAASLASESDDDPGREFARAQTTQRLELLKLRDRVAGGEPDALKPTQGREQQAEVARMMLVGLNSDRINTVHIEHTRRYIKQASQMNLQEAYVVLSWVVENAVRRYVGTDQANTLLRPLYEAARLSAELAFRIAARIRSITDLGISVARRSELSGDTLIHPGEREEAFAILEQWAAEATGFIKITDPFFGLDELELIKLIRRANSEIPIFVLTSRKHQHDTGVRQPWDDTYQSHWRMTVSDSDPGEVTIIMLGKSAMGEHPIHDRWWLSETIGLRIGTSVNSLGLGRVSEVSKLLRDGVATRLAEIDRYIAGNALNLDGERIRHSSFRL